MKSFVLKDWRECISENPINQLLDGAFYNILNSAIQEIIELLLTVSMKRLTP